MEYLQTLIAPLNLRRETVGGASGPMSKPSPMCVSTLATTLSIPGCWAHIAGRGDDFVPRRRSHDARNQVRTPKRRFRRTFPPSTWTARSRPKRPCAVGHRRRVPVRCSLQEPGSTRSALTMPWPQPRCTVAPFGEHRQVNCDNRAHNGLPGAPTPPERPSSPAHHPSAPPATQSKPLLES